MQQWFSSARWGLILLAAAVPLTVLATTLLKVPQRVSIPIIMIELLVFGAQAMWQNAKDHATGDEWWQQDQADQP